MRGPREGLGGGGFGGGCPVAFPRANACFEAGDDAVGDFLVEITLGGFGCGGGGGRCHGGSVFVMWI